MMRGLHRGLAVRSVRPGAVRVAVSRPLSTARSYGSISSKGIRSSMFAAASGGVAAFVAYYTFSPLVVVQCKAPDLQSVIALADQLFERNDMEALARLLADYDALAPGSAAIKWRQARCAYKLGDAATDKKQKEAFIREAQNLATEALAMDQDNDFAVHKWYAITLSALGDFLATKEKIGNIMKIREHFDKACELNPQDPTSRHLLGMWCVGVSEVAWYERRIAAAIFGTIPESTWEEALQHFVEAEKLEPGFYKKNQVMIGKCYLKMGKPEEAKPWLEKALKLPIVDADDQGAQDEAKDLLKRC
eukprot:Clim_evm8s222 gene=Clim_evmTU8s222